MKTLNVLLAPGIGDAHWVLLKLEAFLKERDAKAYVWSMCPEPSRRRAMGFLRRVPFVTAVDDFLVTPEKLKKVLPLGVNDEPRDVIEGGFGFDYYLCFNKSLRDGGFMSDILPGLQTNWEYPIIELPEDRRVVDRIKKDVGAYAVFYFSSYGMHRTWASHFSPGRAQELLKLFRVTFPDLAPVLVGMPDFDGPFNRALGHLAYPVLGETSTEELLSVLRHAACVVGFHNGPTIIAQHLGTPTIMLWSRSHFKYTAFRMNWVNPANLGKLYLHHEVEGVGVQDLIRDIASIRKM